MWKYMAGTRTTLSMKYMCEAIVRSGICGSNITPEGLFHYSPTGELSLIYALYDTALMLRGKWLQYDKELPDDLRVPIINSIISSRDGVLTGIPKSDVRRVIDGMNSLYTIECSNGNLIIWYDNIMIMSNGTDTYILSIDRFGNRINIEDIII